MSSLDKQDVAKLLIPLVRFPWVVSFIEEFYVEYLLDEGFLEPTTLLVSASGRDFVAANDISQKVDNRSDNFF